ncbi:MAG: MATE family efflux transporter [Oscillospiraceae bacterium]|nr:MATE family efflux transporter [Oscillospiraceae bacterium]
MQQFANTTPDPLGTHPIGRLLLKYSIPTVISLLVSSLYNIVDQIFIGQGVGLLGNAATNVAFPISTITTAVAMLLGVGTAANFNLKMGAGERDNAKKIAGNGILFMAFFGIVIAVLISLFLKPMLWAFGATEENYTYVWDYTKIIVLGLPFFIFANGASYLIRSDGSPAFSMLCTVSGAIVNIILDPIFIFPLGMGMAGAAWATIIGQILSAALAAGYFIVTKLRTVRFDRGAFKPSAVFLRRIAALGVAPFLTHIAMTVVQIVLNNTLNHYGAASAYGTEIPLAISGIITKVNSLLMAFTLGIALGMQPIVGYNYGHRNYRRVKQTLKKAVIAGLVISFVFFLAFQFAPRHIASVFGAGTELYYEFAEKYFRIFMMLLFGGAIQPIIANFFNSIGRPTHVLSLSRQLIFQAPLIIILPLIFGIDGVLYAGPIADAAVIILAVVLCRRLFKKMPDEKITA